MPSTVSEEEAPLNKLGKPAVLAITTDVGERPDKRQC